MSEYRIIPSNPRYSINLKGVVIDNETNLEREIKKYNGRSEQVSLQLPSGRGTSRAINTLLKETFPENYEIEPMSETIYHLEGVIPNTILNKTQIELRKHFTYDLETGIVYDNVTKKEASYLDGNGYKAINRYGFKALTHKLIMLYMLGKEFPNSEVDHIDHNRSNNSWNNLRVVCRKTNSRNLSKHKTNTSGYVGVSWHKQKNKWRAYIMVNYKQVYLGLFSNIEDAIKAREEASIKYKFHVNHGK